MYKYSSKFKQALHAVTHNITVVTRVEFSFGAENFPGIRLAQKVPRSMFLLTLARKKLQVHRCFGGSAPPSCPHTKPVLVGNICFDSPAGLVT